MEVVFSQVDITQLRKIINLHHTGSRHQFYMTGIPICIPGIITWITN